MNDPLSAMAQELARWACGLLLLGTIIAAFLRLTRKHEPSAPRATCRRCGYDVRATPEICPECGATVPDEIRLRIDLMDGTPPRYLLEDAAALPMRPPARGERFRALAITQEKAQHDRLVTLLRRAGIASESDFDLMPRPQRSFQPMRTDPDRPRLHVSVPEADYAVAMELLAHVRRTSPAHARTTAATSLRASGGSDAPPSE